MAMNEYSIKIRDVSHHRKLKDIGKSRNSTTTNNVCSKAFLDKIHHTHIYFYPRCT